MELGRGRFVSHSNELNFVLGAGSRKRTPKLSVPSAATELISENVQALPIIGSLPFPLETSKKPLQSWLSLLICKRRSHSGSAYEHVGQ